MKVRVLINLDKEVLEYVDEIAKGVKMSRSEFINFVLSAGLQASEMVDQLLDKWFDQRKTEVKEKIKAVMAKPVRYQISQINTAKRR